jgi:chloramphenicol 3-O-phosphotransferase
MAADWGNSKAVVLISGICASGKSTVARALAQRLPRSVHLPGDGFRRMIVNGRADMTPALEPEAVRQLQLRYRLAAVVADTYFDAGFTVVVQDVVLGEDLSRYVEMIRSRPLLVVMLVPRADVVAVRERDRSKVGYQDWRIEALDDELRHRTPRLGLWLDSSGQTPAQTVAEILERAWAEAAVQ